MEDKHSSGRKTLMSIGEGKLSRQVACDHRAGDSPRLMRKALQLDLEIHRKNLNQRSESKKVSVIIKPRRSPSIHTIFVARTKDCQKVCLPEAFGDYTSTKTLCSVDNSNAVIHSKSPDQRWKKLSKCIKHTSEAPHPSELQCNENIAPININNDINHKNKTNLDETPKYKSKISLNFYSKAEKLLAPKAVVKTIQRSQDYAINHLLSRNRVARRIDNYLEKKILQEMVLRSLDGNVSPPSSDEEPPDRGSRNAPSDRAGCSYIEQYSHVPETSAFQRHALTSIASPRGTSIEKEHNSEQYGRDFTAYDGITARSRRQSASVPCKRDDTRQAAERVHKIRHNLNPVRDYRLMDTVHYLAQGEFAPRDDGIKLTPSREAVLSDIIWEDVCRTHWPSARLNRRITTHPERNGGSRRGSGELQRLIDNLLRERVAHVERRRRRHYRIVKLNNRHETGKLLGKTGDIIVASHKKKERGLASSDHRATAEVPDSRWAEQRGHKSHDRLGSERHRQTIRLDDCTAGPSYAVNRVVESREERVYTAAAKAERSDPATKPVFRSNPPEATSSSASNASNKNTKSARLVIRKEVARRKPPREDKDLEHYILLPTLVVRTPSNMRRQKKFNELYHRILRVHFRNRRDGEGRSETAERNQGQSPDKKDIGLNINITSDSEDHSKMY